MTDRNAIFATPRARKEVPCPEWGCTLYVNKLSAREFLRLNERIKAEPEHAAFHSIIASTVDESGAAMFQEGDAAALAEQPWQAVNRLAAAHAEMNGDKETAAGNSQTR